MLLILCLAAAVFAGCSDTTDPGSTPSSTPDGTPDASQTQTSEPGFTAEYPWQELEEGAPEPEYGGTAYVVQTNRTNFYMPSVSGKGTQMLICPAVESLGRQLNDGTWVPFLAESWEADPDALTFTIKLREGIKFSDGSDLNAEVVVWNIEESLAHGKLADLGDPSSVEALDEYTILLKFENGWSSVLEELYGMFRVVSKYSYDTYGEDYMKTTPVGTGAFVMTEATPGTSFTFTARDDYWQEGLPYLDEIVMMVITDENTKISALISGELSCATTAKGSTVAQMAGVDGVKSVTLEGPALGSFYAVGMNSVDTPFEDELVRQAAMYALDRDAIGYAISEGLGKGICQFGLEGSNVWLPDDELYSTYDYDPEKAKELLTEAGYPDGFEITFYAASNQQDFAVAVKSYLDAIGIITEIELHEYSELQSMNNTNMIQGICNIGGSAASLDYGNFMARTVSVNRTQMKLIQKEFYELSDLILKQQAATSKEESDQLAKQMGYLYNKELPSLPVYTAFNSLFLAENLYGINYNSVQSFQWTPDTAYFAG